MAASVLPPIRAETTASVASSFDQLHPRAREKQKLKVKEHNDPLKVLDPARKKLTSVEAQRVLSVLDETIRRVEVVSLLPHIIENLGRYSVILGTDLVQSLEAHDRLQSLYQKAVSKFGLEQRRSGYISPTVSDVGSSRASSQASKETAGQEKESSQILGEQPESRVTSAGSVGNNSQRSQRLSSGKSQVVDIHAVQALEFQIGDSLRAVLRLFSSNPAAMSAVRGEKYQRSFETNKMIDGFTTLRAILFEKLLTTPSEEKERRQYLKEVVNRERKSSTMASKLQEELKKAIDDKDNEVF